MEKSENNMKIPYFQARSYAKKINDTQPGSTKVVLSFNMTLQDKLWTLMGERKYYIFIEKLKAKKRKYK